MWPVCSGLKNYPPYVQISIVVYQLTAALGTRPTHSNGLTDAHRIDLSQNVSSLCLGSLDPTRGYNRIRIYVQCVLRSVCTFAFGI